MGYVSLRGRQKTKRVSLWGGIWRDEEEGGLVKLVTGEFTLSSDRLRQKGSSVIVLLVSSGLGATGGLRALDQTRWFHLPHREN